MRVNLKYKASSGNIYDLQASKLLTRAANYHLWAFEAVGTELQFGLRVSNFIKEPAAYETQLVFRGPEIQRKAMIEALHEDFERDIRNKTPGRIIWGDYYIDCYITESSTGPDDTYLWTDNDIVIYCPYPFWIKEETKSFTAKEAPEGQTFLDYDYDFDYDFFLSNPGVEIWHKDFPFQSEFKMIVYGPVVDPRIIIDGHPYQFNDTLVATEYAVIDSRNSSITKYTSSNQPVNIFDLRDKINSIFQPIPGGDLTVTWSGLFGFDVTLYEERSEPRWTI